MTADRVEAPFSSAGQGLESAGGKPADAEKIYRLISFSPFGVITERTLGIID